MFLLPRWNRRVDKYAVLEPPELHIRRSLSRARYNERFSFGYRVLIRVDVHFLRKSKKGVYTWVVNKKIILYIMTDVRLTRGQVLAERIGRFSLETRHRDPAKNRWKSCCWAIPGRISDPICESKIQSERLQFLTWKRRKPIFDHRLGVYCYSRMQLNV